MISFVNVSFFPPHFCCSIFTGTCGQVISLSPFTQSADGSSPSSQWSVFGSPLHLGLAKIHKHLPEVETGGNKGPKELPRNFNKDQQDVHHSSSYKAIALRLQTMPTRIIHFHKAKQKCQDERRSFCEVACLDDCYAWQQNI